MGMALAKLAQEDPTFNVHTDIDSGQTIIAGMGELHLEIIVDRMMREYKVEANVGKPQVAYRETIRSNSDAEGKYIRQTGGSGNYGHCKIRISPNEPGAIIQTIKQVWEFGLHLDIFLSITKYKTHKVNEFPFDFVHFFLWILWITWHCCGEGKVNGNF